MNFFPWASGATDAGAGAGAGAADANADAGQRPRPVPLDLGERPLDDAQKWKRSRARWDLAISPDSPEFANQLAVFEKALNPDSGKSIDDTLREHFSNYEVHKFSGWADRKREPDLYKQQKSDARAYHALLATPPWDREAPQAFLAFKMTMLFFGFSVEPMKMNDYFRLPPGSGLFGLDDDGDSDLDDQRTFIPEDLRPLRFLNRYGKRCYGADNGHSRRAPFSSPFAIILLCAASSHLPLDSNTILVMPDPTFEMYYGLPFLPQEVQQPGHGGTRTGAQADMRIRGGCLGEDRDDNDEDDTKSESESESMSDGSGHGTSFFSDFLLPNTPHVQVDDGVGGDGGRALVLRGGAGNSGTAKPLEESIQTEATAAQGHGHGVLHQGVPQLGAGVDMFQSGKYYREQSFAAPLSVQVGDQKPRFPINAPPVEHIRRPRGPGGAESDSMPIVSTHIMTPTEQRTLQQAFFQMRSIALNRAQQCPHKDCVAFFPVGPDNMAAFHKHLDDVHIGSHCPFCDETLFRYWSASDKQKHFVENHSEYFTAKGDLLKETLLADKIKSKGNVHRREEQYSFCPRCGRDHQLLSSKADRVHHDNACFPGNEATLPTEKYCPRCGKPDYILVGSRGTKQHEEHHCAAATTDPDNPTPASDVFCPHCALGCHQLPVSYGRRHLLNCKALASRPDNFCPWCGVDLKSGPRAACLKHLATCVLKPTTGQNPVCTDSGIPLDSPRDLQAQSLRHGLSNLGTSNRKARIAVPRKCPVGGCGADLTSWNAQGLYHHFQSHSENVLAEGGGLKSCPFCKCNFETRGWHTKLEKQQHFDDHIHVEQRARRVLNEEIIGSNPDWTNRTFLQAIATRDYDQFDLKAETENLNAQITGLSQTVKHPAKENSKLRDGQRESPGTCDPNPAALVPSSTL
jgi:hypothetical protein